ncbi:MAG: GHKL domain-containing protein [Deltaproteobacteria bacterium]|nr:GHKL domain-containing protein [Deltaproteobacteria bacterium]
MFNSIKSKLFLWFLVVFSILFLGLGIFLYYKLEDIAVGSIDNHLHAETQLLASLLDVEENRIEWELEKAQVGDYTVPFSGHYYQIALSNQVIIAKSPSLANESLPLPLEKTARILTIKGPKGEPLRLMNYPVRFPTRTIIIQAADSLADTYSLLRSFKTIILIILPVTFIISSIGVIMITSLSLRTLSGFSNRVSRITEKNLNERIEEKGVDKELLPLAASFNNMMTRIEDAFIKQRQFLSDASHELRTPTSVIKSYCDVTLKKERNKNEYEEALNVIRDASERMALLIQKILDISRLETKDILLKKEVIDIGAILNNVYKLMLPIAEENNIEILLNNGKKVDVSGDRERLTELFINLIDNAIKYNKKGGKVIISSEMENGFIIITISDTGIGISDEHLDKIFDRFYRVDKSRGEVSGAGLGLSIVKAIIDAHNGKIEVKSRTGEGSEFKIMLPINLT